MLIGFLNDVFNREASDLTNVPKSPAKQCPQVPPKCPVSPGHPKRLNDTFNGQDSGVGANVTPWVGANVTPVPTKVHQEQTRVGFACLPPNSCNNLAKASGLRRESYGQKGAGYLAHKIWRHMQQRAEGKSNLRFVQMSCHETRQGLLFSGFE